MLPVASGNEMTKYGKPKPGGGGTVTRGGGGAVGGVRVGGGGASGGRLDGTEGPGSRGCASGTEEPEKTVESSAMMPDDSTSGSESHCVGRSDVVPGMAFLLDLRKAWSSPASPGVIRAHSRSSISENLDTTGPRF